MFSSAIWNKLARVNLFRLGKFPSAICGQKCYLFQITREKSYDYLLMIHTKNCTIATNFVEATQVNQEQK